MSIHSQYLRPAGAAGGIVTPFPPEGKQILQEENLVDPDVLQDTKRIDAAQSNVDADQVLTNSIGASYTVV